MTIKRLFFPLFLLFLAFSVTACAVETTTTDGLDYDDFDYIEDYDEVFNRREGTYIVYLYSESCYNCGEIKEDVFAFASTYADRTMFFFNVDGATSDLQNAFLTTLGRTQVGTPSLILIKNNAFSTTASSRYFFSGASAILSILEDLEKGTYQYWQ
ncbi:MAG: hypothetical protein Q8N15_04820 [Bacillota bacterium]|nr:hypothetical protein [Bacillota bacterium]